LGTEKGKFFIDSRSKRATVRERELRDAWVEWSISSDERRETDAALRPAREKFLAEEKKFTNITDFP